MSTGSFNTMFPDRGFRFLSREQQDKIHYAALYIMEKIGISFHSKEAVDMLEGAGARVKGDKVFIPQNLVMKAIESAPSSIKLYSRNGDYGLHAQDRNVYFGGGCNHVFRLDLDTGKQRKITKQDVEEAAIVFDYLPNLDYANSLGYISGLNPYVQDIQQFYSVVTNTTKPIYIAVYDMEALKVILDMSVAIRGSLEELQRKPLWFCLTPSTSPLQQSKATIDRLLFFADHGIPCVGDAVPMAGGTGPCTLAGNLATGVAETLSALVIHQLRKPGSPYLFSGVLTIQDMKTSIMSFGAPEQVILTGSMAEMAHYYDLPFWGTGGGTDSKIVDQQSAIEAALTIMGQAMTGAGLVHACGYMEGALMSSLEQLVMDDEIIGMVKRMLGGISINDEELALDIIERVGPGGLFLTDKHTLKHFRNRWNPTLMDRRNYKDWESKGSLSMGDRIKNKVKHILDTHQPEPLQDEVSRELKKTLDIVYKNAGV